MVLVHPLRGWQSTTAWFTASYGIKRRRVVFVWEMCSSGPVKVTVSGGLTELIRSGIEASDEAPLQRH